MRLAYICNVYPAVSHSFVRREIEGLEAIGHEVHRFSIRPADKNLKDPADLREVAYTEVVLGQGWARLLATALLELISRPMRFFAGIGATYRMGGPGLTQKAKHGAYLVEAAWLLRRAR